MFDIFVLKWVMLIVIYGVIVSPTREITRTEDEWECDSDATLATEGIIGQSPLFPWLGILKARLHGVDTFTEFITTIVMIKDGFALCIADDIARMPQYIFKGFVSVMFITQPGKFWFSRLLDYMAHPEYDEETLANSIAIVQLELLQDSFPVKPICLPYDFNADSLSSQLYAVLYEDENIKLEKAIHAMQYTNKKSCQQFYKKRGFTQANLEPKHLQCAHAINIPVTCVWEAGVALVSNATGPWVLLGLGTKSLGCAHPTRFIDIVPYILWIDTVTSVELESDTEQQIQYRRTGFNIGFGKEIKQKPMKEEEPPNLYQVPKFFPGEQQTEQKQDPYIIKRLSQNEVAYIPSPNQDYDYCDNYNNRLLYHNTDEIKAPNQGGRLDYKIILHDENHLDQTCTRITLKAQFPDTSVIYGNKVVFKKERSYYDDEYPQGAPKMVVPPPSHQILQSRRTGTEMEDSEYVTGMDQYQIIVEKDLPKYPGDTHTIFLRLEFEYDAEIEVQVLTPHILTRSTTVATTKATRSAAKRRSDVIPLPRTSRVVDGTAVLPLPHAAYDTVIVSPTAVALVSRGAKLGNFSTAIMTLTLLLFILVRKL